MKMLASLFIGFSLVANAQSNAWKTVSIGAVQGSLGTHIKCSINGQWALVQGLSGDVVAAYDNYQKLDKEVKDMAAWIKKEDKRIRDAQANGPQEAPSGTPAGNRIRQLNIDARKLEEKQEELETKMASLKDATAKFKEVSEIEAVETKQSYSGMKVWVAKRK